MQRNQVQEIPVCTSLPSGLSVGVRGSTAAPFDELSFVGPMDDDAPVARRAAKAKIWLAAVAGGMLVLGGLTALTWQYLARDMPRADVLSIELSVDDERDVFRVSFSAEDPHELRMEMTVTHEADRVGSADVTVTVDERRSSTSIKVRTRKRSRSQSTFFHLNQRTTEPP